MNPESVVAPTARRPAFPAGIVILLTYLAVSAIGWVWPLAVGYAVGPFLISGIPAMMLRLGLAGASALAFWGAVRRRTWARTLTIALVVAQFVLALLSLALFLIEPRKSMAVAQRVTEAVIEQKFKGWARSPAFQQGVRAASRQSALLTQHVSETVLNVVTAAVVIVYLRRQRGFFGA